ncbi:hypothetical protein [Pseudovibrio sp. SCP19]|uniref:hypothetical protein n=1 Tax=Pseudovibrio sp. SCP19 TaxID=3141374 RepID=UPI0033367360
MPISNASSSPPAVSSGQIQQDANISSATTKTEVANESTKAAHEGKTGYFYAPFVSDDVLKMVSGTNLSRFNAGKELRSLIVATNADKAKFEVLKHELAEKNYKEAGDLASGFNSYMAENDLSETGFITTVGPNKFEDMLKAASDHAWRADALLRVKVISNEETGILGNLKTKEDKLYLVGHGRQGEEGITSKTGPEEQGWEVAWSKDIAQQLAKGGLEKSFSDIRVSSCHSADARLPKSFSPEDLKAASETKVKSFLFIEVEREQSFAQALANDLKKAGFEQPEVSGYHGLGKVFSADTHQYQALDETDGAETARSSSVREVFIPV